MNLKFLDQVVSVDLKQANLILCFLFCKDTDSKFVSLTDIHCFFL